MLHSDIVVFDFEDTYRNLTLKTLTSLHWAVNTFNTPFILKIDDDMVANVKEIIRLLKAKINPSSEIILGECLVNVPVIRNMTSKYYVNHHDYPFTAWPPFCFGTGYVISSFAVRHLLAVANDTRLCHLEDVSLGILARRVESVRILNVRKWKGITMETNTCPGTFTFHNVTPEAAETLWTRCMMGRKSGHDVIPNEHDVRITYQRQFMFH